jgi:hypothetical protein
MQNSYNCNHRIFDIVNQYLNDNLLIESEGCTGIYEMYVIGQQSPDNSQYSVAAILFPLLMCSVH